MHKYSILLTAAVLVIATVVTGSAVPAQDMIPPAVTAQPASSTPQSEQAGSAVLAVGSVTDTALDGSSRQLQDGDPVYSGDTITTGDDSYADLDFEDGGRMLLRPDTDFQIQQYHYDPAAHGYALAPPAEPDTYVQTAPAQAVAPPQPVAAGPQPAVAKIPATAPAQQEHESAFFRLIKGGFRAISGFIGHVEHQDYAVETPVATIGVRGTGYEVRYCDSNCPAGEKGLYTGVGKGIIAVRNQAGESLTRAGHFGYVRYRNAAFQPLQHAPRALQHMQLPPRYRARDARNFRRVRMHRQQRWKSVARQRGHKINNPRGIRSMKPGQGNRPPRYGTLHGSTAKVQAVRHTQHQKAGKKRKHPPRHHHDGRGRG